MWQQGNPALDGQAPAWREIVGNAGIEQWRVGDRSVAKLYGVVPRQSRENCRSQTPAWIAMAGIRTANGEKPRPILLRGLIVASPHHPSSMQAPMIMRCRHEDSATEGSQLESSGVNQAAARPLPIGMSCGVRVQHDEASATMRAQARPPWPGDARRCG